MITFERMPDGWEPGVTEEMWELAVDPDECQHAFVAVGMTDYGTLYECTKCGGLTP